MLGESRIGDGRGAPTPLDGDWTAGAGGKVMSMQRAIATFVTHGCVIGLGGQNITRCPIALVHEAVRQRIQDLTVVGCNLSLPLDILVGMGLVKRTEQGSGNLEKYGVLHAWRRRVESGAIETVDHSHLAMASRFLAAANGAPFMPTRSLLGSDLLDGLVESGAAVVAPDPWNSEADVVLMRALQPDVSLIHGSVADTDGNVLIDGVTTHEVEMVRASTSAIASVEEIVDRGAIGQRAEDITISSAHISAVVRQPYGCFPTALYRWYDFWDVGIKEYQQASKAGDADLARWLGANVTDVRTFDEHLELQDPGGQVREKLAADMGSIQ